MVHVSVSLDSFGALSRLSLEGHAGHGTKGENLACAALSLVVRSTARLLAGQEDWTVDARAPEAGRFFLEINGRPEGKDEWLCGITAILLRTLADIDSEYPDALSVDMEEK